MSARPPSPRSSANAPRTALRVDPASLPPAKPRPPEREGLLFPWMLATLSGTLLLWGAAMALFKLRLLPFRLCAPVTNAIALLAIASVVTGLLLALLRRIRRH